MKRILILTLAAVVAGTSLAAFAGRDQSQIMLQEQQYKALAKQVAAPTASPTELPVQMQSMMDSCMKMMGGSTGTQKK